MLIHMSSPSLTGNSSSTRNHRSYLRNPPCPRSCYLSISVAKKCRQAKLTYSGRLSATVCLQYEGDLAILRDTFSFGQFPIVLKEHSNLTWQPIISHTLITLSQTIYQTTAYSSHSTTDKISALPHSATLPHQNLQVDHRSRSHQKHPQPCQQSD
ncbi:uncharacterized protein LOC131611455 isoform X2 [Vicia villosa]|uniref:uncharacterized protein LOC131611455 isoform X2 n=1 Tax=Vicia villosa TaxID=3911 RepID=UPI00273A7FE1|nr:uncharacterized protein LOC131611455 isoform X2 [Vicia villosa]